MRLTVRWQLVTLFSAAAALLLMAAGLWWRYTLYRERLVTPLQLSSPYVLTIEAGSNFYRILHQLRQDALLDN